MGILPKQPECTARARWPRETKACFPGLLASVCLVCMLAACTAMRPVVKIGLLAPFEGRHRHSGYEALAAMGAALSEHPLPGVEVLPLALNTSADPQQARRAAQKLLQDGNVAAVVGPLQPRQAAAVADIMATTDVLWLLPLAPASADEAQALVAALAAQIDRQAIVLAGLDAGWPPLSPEDWAAIIDKEVRVSDEAVTAAEGVLWLGDAMAGAAFLARLWAQDPSIPFWTTSIGGDPLFFRLLAAQRQSTGMSLTPVYWGILLDESAGHYSEWASSHTPATPTAYAIYQATQRALAHIPGTEHPPSSPARVQAHRSLAIFSLQTDGSSRLQEVVPFP